MSPAGSSDAVASREAPRPAAPRPTGADATAATPGGTPTPGAADVAGYVADLCSELADLAKGADLGFLAFLLDVAREEAVVRHIEAGARPADGARPE